MQERLAEASELQDTITFTDAPLLIGTQMSVLVDAPGIARSFREAPEIDGVIRVPETYPVGSFQTVTVTDVAGVDLEAVHRMSKTDATWPPYECYAQNRSSSGGRRLLTPANAVTITRLGLSPILLVMIASGGASWPALAGWIVLTATDGFDGYIARRHGVTSSGAFLDPLADKVLVLGALSALMVRGDLWWLPAGLIGLRELAVSMYRSRLAQQGVSVPARWWAKVKTVVTEVAIGSRPSAADHRRSLVVHESHLGGGRAHIGDRRPVSPRRRSQSPCELK